MRKGAARRHPGFDVVTRMGFLIHELRNALSCVYVANSMLKRSSSGRAGALLERNLENMRVMLERASLEIRLLKESPARRAPIQVIDAVRQVALTAAEEARRKGLALSVRVEPRLAVVADAAYLTSALANLVQNAVKFTKPGGAVRVRGFEKGGSVVLEVEDQCGGLPAGGISALFEPFTQRGEDRSGLGLGLAISRRAVELNRGSLSARNLPGRGCVFTIVLPGVRTVPAAGGRAAHHVTVHS